MKWAHKETKNQIETKFAGSFFDFDSLYMALERICLNMLKTAICQKEHIKLDNGKYLATTISICKSMLMFIVIVFYSAKALDFSALRHP